MALTDAGMKLGLRALNGFAGLELLDKIGIREPAERLIYRGAKNGTRTAATAGRAFTATTKRAKSKPARMPAASSQGLFDLTPTEARVARALGRGATVAEIAAGNGVAQPTVRNQIREIFAKTGVRRQADLVGLLRGVSGPAGGKPTDG